jgi:hypothetical protein
MKLAFLIVASAACTSARPTTPVSPALATLAFYVGDWACDGTAFDPAGTPTEHLTLGVEVRPAIENWFRITVLEHGTPVTSELKGFDPTTRTFHHLWTSRDGSSGSLTSATGWHGNTLVFDEDHAAPTSRTRMTFTKVDDTHFTHRAETDLGAGYRVEFEKRCTKRS